MRLWPTSSQTPVSHIEPKHWDRLVAVNLTASFRLIRSVEPLLRASFRDLGGDAPDVPYPPTWLMVDPLDETAGEAEKPT